MKNKFLDEGTAQAIDAQVAKVLRGLGNPEPPLDLLQVRELLKLDRHYYSSSDDSPLREYVSRMKIAGRQLVMRPTLIFDVVRKLDLKALYVPDSKRILIDSSQPQLKWRWFEAHEIAHSIIEWHGALMHGDRLYTLSPSCHAQVEAEANYGAGRLLFLQHRFIEFARSSSPSFNLVKQATKAFGNTMTSSLWRLVEALEVPAVGVVSQHPRHTDDSFDPERPCRYFIRSRRFEEEFSEFSDKNAFEVLKSHCSFRNRGPVGKEELVLRNDRGDEHVFLFEAFSNTHETLTLLTYLRPHATTVSISF